MQETRCGLHIAYLYVVISIKASRNRNNCLEGHWEGMSPAVCRAAVTPSAVWRTHKGHGSLKVTRSASRGPGSLQVRAQRLVTGAVQGTSDLPSRSTRSPYGPLSRRVTHTHGRTNTPHAGERPSESPTPATASASAPSAPPSVQPTPG